MLHTKMKSIVRNACESQASLAEKLGISQPRMNHYLNGKREPDIAFLLKFCKYFGKTLNDLFDDFTSYATTEEVNIDILSLIICKVEEWLQDNSLALKPKDKAEAISLIYKKIIKIPSDRRNEKIIDFMEIYESLKKAN